MTDNQKISLKIDDQSTMPCYTAMPKTSSPFPGIILLQEAFGVNHHIRNVADRLAEAGYAVIAPELYHRTAPGFECDYTDFTATREHISALTEDGLKKDLDATYNWLNHHSNVKKDKIASIGFCLGGRISFLANLELPIIVGISYYGARTHTLADRAASLHAPHLFFWGGQDQHITPEHVNTVTDALTKAGKPYINVTISYAGHGFNCDERASYHPQAASEAWALTLNFLKNKLG